MAGINLEDGIPPESGMRSIPDQVALIAAIRARTGLFINARTDLFLQNPVESHEGLMPEAIERARAYREAGADGFFVPGLIDPKWIQALCEIVPLPVNVMKSPSAPAIETLAMLGVARISFGPFPWREAMAGLAEACIAQTKR